MPNTVKIELDLDRIWNPIDVGLRRAYVFAGFGLNASNDPGLTDFHLPGLMKLSFAPESVSEDLLREYKREFANWILGNALREIIESLEICLGNVFRVCILVGQSQRKPHSRKIERDFNRSGASSRLKLLGREFGFSSKNAVYVESLNVLRNCLTHRRDIVAHTDCNDPSGEQLKIKYLRFQFDHETMGGETIIIPPETSGPLFFKDGGMLAARIVEVERSFPLGSAVSLANPDIRDALFTCWNAGLELRSELLGYLRRQGVQVEEKAAQPTI